MGLNGSHSSHSPYAAVHRAEQKHLFLHHHFTSTHSSTALLWQHSALPWPGLCVQAQGQKPPMGPATPGEIPPGLTQVPLQPHQKHAALQHRCALILWIALCSFRCSWLTELQTEGSHGSVPGLGAHLQPKHLLTLWVTNGTEKESVPVCLS